MRIYLCPALIDWIVFLVQFAVLYGAGERHMSTLECAWLGGVLQIGYMLTSLGIGFVVTQRNARALLLVGTIGSVGLGATALHLTGFVALLVTLAVFALFLSIFFNAFQSFMRRESPPGGLARTVGAYTVAWSLGGGLGFLSSGYFYRLGAYVLCAVVLAVGLAVLLILMAYRPRVNDGTARVDATEAGGAGSRPVNPGYVALGWLIIFAATFVQRPLQTFYPSMSAAAGVSPFMAGLPLFLQMVFQGAAGAGMIRLRGALYRRLPFAAVQASAAAMLIVAGLCPGPIVAFAVVGLFGV